MTKPDLAGVDPDRRGEVARRIEVLERYSAIEKPGAEEDESHADEIGIGVAQFLRLAKVWREHRRADLLPGATRRPRRPRGPSMSPDARGVVAEVIRQTGPDVAPAALRHAVADRLKSDGLSLPGEREIWTMLMRARAARRENPAMESVIAIDEVGLDLPVHTDLPRRLPVLHLALETSSGSILAWRVASKRMGPGDAAVLLMEILDQHAPIAETVLLPEGDGPGWQALGTALSAATARPGDERHRRGMIARRTIGDRIGPIKIRNAVTRRADARSSLEGSSMSWREVGGAVAEAVVRHNVAEGRRSAALIGSPDERERLRERLAALIVEEKHRE